MPPVAQNPSAGHARNTQLNPNKPNDGTAQTVREFITHKPSPAIVTTASHVGTHVLPRRFLGPMPENVVNSKELLEKRRRFRTMRKGALRRIRGDDEDLVDQVRRGSVAQAVQKIRIRRRGKHGEDIEEDVDLKSDGEDDSDDDDDEEDGRHRLRRKKKKKKRKDVWVGVSFDIGREFLKASRSASDDTAAPDGFVDQPVSETAVPPQRPSNPSRSTLGTFVTARTEISDIAGPSRPALTIPITNGNGYHLGDDMEPSPLGSPSPALTPRDPKIRDSQTSSMLPLIGAKKDDQDAHSRQGSKGKATIGLHEVSPDAKTNPSSLKKRLKSAIRKSPSEVIRSSTSVTQPISNGNNGLDHDTSRAKTVHFPVGSPEYIAAHENDEEPLRRGNKAPADPEAVLAREGNDAAGTSAGAAEEAMDNDQDNEEQEEDILPGEVIMRGEWYFSGRSSNELIQADRMLVHVGHHRDEDIGIFDEASQVRLLLDLRTSR